MVEGGIDEFEVGKRGKSFTTADGRVSIDIPEGVFDTVVKLLLQTALAEGDSSPKAPHPPLSDFIALTPGDLRIDAGTPMKMSVQLDATTIGDKIPHVMRNVGTGWEKVDSLYADDVHVMEFLVTSGGSYYVAEGGDSMPPAPSPTKPDTPSNADVLLDRICVLFDDDAEKCRLEVEEMQKRGLDNLYIGKKLLAEFELLVVAEMKKDVASPAKRELLKSIMELFEEE